MIGLKPTGERGAGVGRARHSGIVIEDGSGSPRKRKLRADRSSTVVLGEHIAGPVAGDLGLGEDRAIGGVRANHLGIGTEQHRLQRLDFFGYVDQFLIERRMLDRILDIGEAANTVRPIEEAGGALDDRHPAHVV